MEICDWLRLEAQTSGSTWVSRVPLLLCAEDGTLSGGSGMVGV